MNLHDLGGNRPPSSPLTPEFNAVSDRARRSLSDSERGKFFARFNAALNTGDDETARGVTAELLQLHEARVEAEACAMASTRLKRPHPHLDLIARIERDGRTKLHLGERGAIECHGPQPEPWLIQCLRHEPITAAMRDFLDARQAVTILVAAPEVH